MQGMWKKLQRAKISKQQKEITMEVWEGVMGILEAMEGMEDLEEAGMEAQHTEDTVNILF